MNQKRQGTVMRFKEWLAMQKRRQALIRRIKRTLCFYRIDDDNYAIRIARSDE
jgi:hypothetical protein